MQCLCAHNIAIIKHFYTLIIIPTRGYRAIYINWAHQLRDRDCVLNKKEEDRGEIRIMIVKIIILQTDCI